MYEVRIEIEFDSNYFYMSIMLDSSAVYAHEYAKHVLVETVEKYFTDEQKAGINDEAKYVVIPVDNKNFCEWVKMSKTYREIMQ